MKLKDTEQLEELLVVAIEAVRQHNIKTAGLDELEAALTYLRALLETHEERTETHACDCISRQEALEAVFNNAEHPDKAYETIRKLPPAQPERDIPVKPIETTDKAWGIPHKQAVCPKCDYYLGHVAFLGDYKGKRITYCETCGQAIDWEGWNFDE